MIIEELAQSIAGEEKVPITKYLSGGNRIVNVENEPILPAVYLFWYKNDDCKLWSLSRKLSVKGPGGSVYRTTWYRNMEKDYVSLYVGKSTRLLRSNTGKRVRLSEHLLPGTPRNIYEKYGDYIREKYEQYGEDGQQMRAKPKNNTSCQFRSGFDFLYRKQNGAIIFDEIRKRIYMTIHYEKNFATRFYLEDYLIGMLQPWFNLDAER